MNKQNITGTVLFLSTAMMLVAVGYMTVPEQITAIDEYCSENPDGELRGDFIVNCSEHLDKETDKICVNRTYTYEFGYFPGDRPTKPAYPSIGKINLSSDYVLEVRNYTSTGGGVWVSMDTSEAPISYPDKVVVNRVSKCLTYKETGDGS